MFMRALSLLTWALLAILVLCELDYYKVLGVDREASERDIKRQYRKLSKQWHPDKNKGDEGAHEKFVQLSEGSYVNDPES
jgi:DnaJ-related protein SCJ1